MREENCIFCKIAAGEIPSKTIYEDEQFRVILDISPASKGHALIIPKEHYADIYKLPEDMAGQAMILAKKLALHMTETLNCDGFNIVQNNGETAGQTVFHFHMHLIPRYEQDGNQDKLCWNHLELSQEELEDICQKLSRNL
ncbi:HIT family protein [Petralouisia muris]|jgi:histidine triad (HIT) family protein|uniref:HIT family protein n=1 Tax=Petralouisia muris TaxID=3032872 RepID=A0AC61RW15_9FIRM|nr:HIT family protein [Petralouisia muris]TGY96072.1 HIT family protein [Petralouisia muris]